VAPDPPENCTVINKSSETFHLQCVPGFDGGMEQYFLVTVTDRSSGNHFLKDFCFSIISLENCWKLHLINSQDN